MLGHRFRISAAGLVVAIAACNAPGASPIPTRTQVAPTAAATAGPAISTPVAFRGTWTTDLQGTTASSGAWVMRVSETNVSLQNPVGGDPFTLDPTAFSETAVTFPAAADCPDQAVVTPGSYTVAVMGETLVFTLVSDSCGDRSATLVTAPWMRVP